MAKAGALILSICLMSLPGGCGGGGGAPAPDEGNGDNGNVPQFRGFNSMTALSFLQKQVDFGPRPPNSEAHEKLRAYLVETLGQWATVTQQAFDQQVQGVTYRLTNILGVIPAAQTAGRAETAKKVLLGAHWDTRPIADRDPDPSRRDEPILGANDAASGIAVLLEVARILSKDPANVQVIIALWDGEDFGNFIYGSTYFASHMGELKPDLAINIDMIGDADLHVNREANSLRAAPDLFASVLKAAEELGFEGSFDGRSLNIIDDHIPLINKGIPAIDLIDFDYGPNHSYWHTHEDTVDKCSAESLRVIGETVLRVVYATE